MRRVSPLSARWPSWSSRSVVIDNCRPVDGVIAALADGRPIDWAAFEARAGDSDRRLLANARLAATVMALYREGLASRRPSRATLIQISVQSGHA